MGSGFSSKDPLRATERCGRLCIHSECVTVSRLVLSPTVLKGRRPYHWSHSLLEWLLCEVCISTLPSCSFRKPRFMLQLAEGQRSVYFGTPLFSSSSFFQSRVLLYFSQCWAFFWSTLHMGFDDICGDNTSWSKSEGCTFRLHKVDSCPPCCEWHGSLVTPLHTETGRHTNIQGAHIRNIPGDTASAVFLVELLLMAFPLGVPLGCFVW